MTMPVFRTDAEQVARFDAARATHTSEDTRTLKAARDRAKTGEDLRAINALEYRLDVAGKVTTLLPAHLRDTAQHSPNQLHAGERIVDGSACACPQAGACVCRVLPKAERIDTDDGRVDHRDAADQISPPALGGILLDRAKAWLGEERVRVLCADAEREQAAQPRGWPTDDIYRSVMLETIRAADPALATTCARDVPTTDRLRALYSALPDPPTKERTDMAHTDTETSHRRRSEFRLQNAYRGETIEQLDARFDALDAGDGAPDHNTTQRRLQLAHLHTPDGVTSLTQAEQQARVDAREADLDRSAGDGLWRRINKALRVDKADTAKVAPKPAEARVRARLQAILDAGDIDKKTQLEGEKLLNALFEICSNAPADTDAADTEKTDAADPDHLDDAWLKARRNAGLSC